MQFERFFRAGSYFADLVRQTIEDKAEGGFNLTDIPLRSEIHTREEMSLHAVRLAQSHRVKLTGKEGVNLYARFAQNREVIEKSYFAFAEAANANEPLTPGAEWLLDNYHVIEEQVRDIKRHLPRSYYKTLPKLTSEDFTGYPRVYHLAFEIIAHSDALVDSDSLSAFISAYQSEAILTIGELWAVPIMLRLALIENLRRLALANVLAYEQRRMAEELVDGLLGDGSRSGTDVLLELAVLIKDSPEILTFGAVHLLRYLRGKGLKAVLTHQWLEEKLRESGFNPDELIRQEHQRHAANQISIGNTVTALKTVSTTNWRAWFEGVSKVDEALKHDPAHIYALNDFMTRDRCRHRLERMSRRTGMSEVEIARQALELAVEARGRSGNAGTSDDAEDLRYWHVGYYLIDEGLPLLEKRVHYEPGPVVRTVRFVRERAFKIYGSGITALTLFMLGWLMLKALDHGAGIGVLTLIALVCGIPMSHLASDVVQWIVCHLTIPTVLPKLDFENGVPPSCRTLVTVHTIYNDKEAVRKSVEGLEVRFLANDDENIFFALLADLRDSDREQQPGDRDLINYTEGLIAALNQKYPSSGQRRFHVLFRKRIWNEKEQKFMGWERKRGKIMEINRMILGDFHTSFLPEMIDRAFLTSIRYVITLDSDSQLPGGSARKLVGAIAHPLNRAVIDAKRRVVVRGYGILQPRVGVSLGSAGASRFSRIFSGHAGLDPYTQTVSDVYQDLFREGSYLGKGIYDVHAFEAVMHDRVPENALLSHDLFEGLFARVALITDVELIDDFPPRFNVYARRQHRWVRGDWQILPWMFSRVPDAKRKLYTNPISLLGRWKLIDNLRRSLLAPTAFLLLWLSWLVFPGQPLYWTMLFVLIVAFPVYANVANAIVMPPLGFIMSIYVKHLGRDLLKHSGQALLVLSFLPYQAWLMSDAIVRTLYRLYVSRRDLLEWETAYNAEKRLGNDILSFMRELLPAMGLSTLMYISVFIFNPALKWYTLPFFALWYFSPVLAWWISQPVRATRLDLSVNDRRRLVGIAWDTWRYFEELMNDQRNHLIPDNVQLVPSTIVAERTSPTNFGLAVMGTISAYDLGFLPLSSVVRRMSSTFEALSKLERYRGHFLNWYQIVTLQPLYPRYVSTVDSGNFIANMMATRQALAGFNYMPLVGDEHWPHLAALCNSLSQVVRDSDDTLAGQYAELGKALTARPSGLAELDRICGMLCGLVERSKTVLALLSGRAEEDALRRSMLYELSEFSKIAELFAWNGALHGFCALLKGHSSDARLNGREELEKGLAGVFKIAEGRPLSLSILSKMQRRVSALARRFGEMNQELLAGLVGDESRSVSELERTLGASGEAIELLQSQVQHMREQCATYVREADFEFLFDFGKSLFVIGYNVDEARRDPSYYDLLASECRIASLIAIAHGQIPQKHWFVLSRSLADSAGGKALLSWSGTMFEYLMPLIMTRNYHGTILGETYEAVVRAQRAYGRKRGVPWGVSESGYSGVDFEKTYQYYAFGVPGLGLKRGLSEDLVISPYSTFMALVIDPQSCLRNIDALERAGARGMYGFYEAIDYTKERLSSDEKHHVVKSFMAHHQGMSLLCINNLVNNGVFQERFHSDPAIKAVELMLHERFPSMVPAIVPHQAEMSMLEHLDDSHEVSPSEVLRTPHTEYPRTRLLSNGRYSVFVDNAGGGWSFGERGIALTRWREDSVRNDYGTHIFVRDLDTNHLWSVAYQPTRVEADTYEVIFNPDKVEFKRRDFGIALHTEITVSPEDNVEVRRVTVKNLTNRPKNIELTSYGEVVLGDWRADATHPAFAKMFVESEWVGDLEMLMFSRRPRSAREEKLFMFHKLSMPVCWDRTQYETSRSTFLGRANTVHEPQVFKTRSALSGSTGAVLDPVFSLRTRLQIEPGGSEQASFITAMATSREEAMHLAQRYNESHAVVRAFEMAWSQCNVELRNEQIGTSQTHLFQKIANAIFFNVRTLRGEAEAIGRNRLTQSALWRFGISGDRPIVYVSVNDPGQIKTVQELLMCHWYLRQRCLVFDLVIMNEYPGGYLENFHQDLEALIRHGYSGNLMEKDGGVFLRKLNQLSDEEGNLLKAVARVAILGARGSLAQQVAAAFEKQGDWIPLTGRPPFSYIKGREVRRTEAQTQLEYDNGIGGFSDNGRSYSIAVRDEAFPPLPWSNVVANPRFGFLVSESGGGYTWSGNSQANRLTPWSNDPVSDHNGEVVYIRDTESGAYWSATPRPVSGGSTYHVRHGMGFSEFETSVRGVVSKLTISGALEDPVKWWTLKLVNESNEAHQLEVLLYVEWVLGASRQESHRHIVTDFDPASQVLTACNYYNNEFAGRSVFVGTNQKVSTFTTSRNEFIGRNRDTATPYALEKGLLLGLANMLSGRGPLKLSRKTGSGYNSCGVIGVKVNLNPREEKEVLFYMGEAASEIDRRQAADKYHSAGRTQGELQRVRDDWESMVSTIQVKTPERSFDLMMNSWLLYQTLSCRIWGRTGLYQSGGAFGFRDQLQDAMALAWSRPDLARQQILLHASRQFIEGDVQHWWHPPTGRGIRSRISDNYLWLPFVTARYLKVSGDNALLQEEVSYIEGPQVEEGKHDNYMLPSVSGQRGSLYEHCVRAVDRALKFGPHGLPLMGTGDWNDGMNEVGAGGKGESVWLGWFLFDILNRFSEIAARQSDTERAANYKARAVTLQAALEEHAWDGNWYLRAFFDDGTPLGTSNAKECRIDSLSQSWSVLSGAGSSSRVTQAMESVNTHLVDRENGIIKLLTPAFNGNGPNPGYIAGYLPGVRENGAQYTHAASWVVMAFATLGRGDRAFELWQLINPVAHGRNADEVRHYQGEPYVTCGDVYSLENCAGRAGWSWYSGSCGWLYTAGLEYILGLQVEPAGFRVQPCIPSQWDGFQIDCKLRGIPCLIKVSNPEHVENGVKTLLLNGKPVPEKYIEFGTLQSAGAAKVLIEVIMGRA